MIVEYAEWLNKFLPAYEANSVTDKVPFPYLTYNYTEGGENVSSSVSLWYRESSLRQAIAKAEEMKRAIGRGGVVIKTAEGALWIKKGEPFMQVMGDPEDDLIRRIYINIILSDLEE